MDDVYFSESVVLVVLQQIITKDCYKVHVVKDFDEGEWRVMGKLSLSVKYSVAIFQSLRWILVAFSLQFHFL